MSDAEQLAEELYRKLQEVCSCPRGCKLCKAHEPRVLHVLAEFVNRWRATPPAE